MALDKGLVQNINLRADGDQLLNVMREYGREIRKAVAEIDRMNGSLTTGSSKQENKLRSQIQTLQRLIGEASTLQNVLSGSGNRRRDGLLAGLDEQAMGRKTLSASKLKRELEAAKTGAEALEIRLAQLYKKFNDLGTVGKKVGRNDMAKALNTEEAIRQVRKLEMALEKIDARQKAIGGKPSKELTDLRSQISVAQGRLLNRTKDGKRVNFTQEIASIEVLTDRYKKLIRVEQDASALAEKNARKTLTSATSEANRARIKEERDTQATIRSIQEKAAQSEAMLRAKVNRGASQFNFNRDQARTFNPIQTNKEVERGIQLLVAYQRRMSDAVAAGKSSETIGRMGKAFEALSARISEATAKKKAFDALPESRMRALNDALFSGGGLAFATRIAGASVITTGVFAAINALQSGARAVVEFEDGIAKLQAISGATDTEMRKMASGILEVGKSSRYATTEIVESAAAIAQAGYSAQETVGVLSASMDLAAASGSTPAEAIDTMTGALGAFQIEAGNATQVADTLVGGLNRSKLSIQQMQAAIQYAGATANETGMSLEELTAIAASLSNAGIRTGSTIGTGTRQLMVDLKTPTENFKKELADLGLNMADVDVRAKGLMGVVKTLRDNGFSAAAAYGSFETRAASAFLALMGQVDGYDQLAQSIMQTGAAAAAAEQAGDSLMAKFTMLLNSVTSLTVSISGPFMAALSGMVTITTVVVQSIEAIGKSLAEATGATSEFGMIFTNVFVTALTGFFVGGPIGAVIGGLLALVGSLGQGSAEMDKLKAATNDATAKLDSQSTKVRSVDDAISGLISRQTELTSNQGALQTETQTLVTRFEGLATQLNSASGSYDQLLQAMMRYRREQLVQSKLTAQETALTGNEEMTGLQGRLRDNASTLQGRHLNFYNKNKDMILRPSFDMAGQNAIQSQIVGLKQRVTGDKKELNPAEKWLLEALQERLSILQQMAMTNQRISNAENVIALANVKTSEAGENRTTGRLAVESGITAGLELNQRSPGSGLRTLDSVTASAQDMLTRLRARLVTLDRTGAEAKDIESTIRDIEAQVSRVTRTNRIESEAAEKDKPKDRAGGRLSATQVADRIKRLIPGAAVSDDVRSVGQQAGFDRAAGIKRNPNGAPHVQGRAIDMPPIKGMNPMEVVQMLEDMGLEVTEAPVRRAGIRYVPVNHGTGPHWHFAWKSKQTRFEKEGTRDANKAAQDLQQLLEQRAGFETGASEKAIGGYISSAKAGTINLPDARGNLDKLTTAYRTSRLAEFDTRNPTEDMTAAAVVARREAREALEKEITEKAKAWGAELDRAIIDDAGKTLDNTMRAAQRAFDDNAYAAEVGVRQKAADGSALDNDINKRRYGAGATYLQEQNAKKAREAADQQKLGGYRTQETAQLEGIDKYRTQAAGLDPESEAGKAAIEKLDEATKAYNETLRQRVALEEAVTARSQVGVAAMGTLSERLQASAQSWLDASGAMDTWGKKLENAIGPALDNLTAGFTDFFSSIFDGSKSFGAALGDIVKSFAKFVMQMVAQALALMVVKEILKAIGVPMPNYGGGAVSGNDAQIVVTRGKFGGGPTTDWGGCFPQMGGRYDGGPIHSLYGGGKIKTGFSNRDSSLYNLAHGEYVVRNKSVRELGLPFMESINKHGKAGLNKMAGAGSAFTNIQAPRQETNVFVVADKKSAGMTRNDVLVTLQDDILQNGTTKRLIRQVAQGG